MPLAVLSPWRAVLWIAIDWLVILAVASIAWRVSPIVWPVAWFLIAARQHALLVLMHEGAHYLLLGKSWTNEALADTFCAYPFGITTDGYRRKHLRHHAYLNSQRDPDWVLKTAPETRLAWEFPRTWRQVATLLSRDLIGGGLGEVFGKLRRMGGPRARDGRRPPARPARIVGRVGYYVVVATGVMVTGIWIQALLFWVVPILTFLPALLRLRSIAEHFGLPGGHELNNARNVLAPIWERWLFAPHHIGRHLDHHLFPYVPFYHLPELGRRLRADPRYAELAYRNGAYLFGGRHSVLRDLAAVPGRET